MTSREYIDWEGGRKRIRLEGSLLASWGIRDLVYLKKQKKKKTLNRVDCQRYEKGSKTHKRLKKCFLKRGLPQNCARFVLFRPIKKRSFNFLCFWDLVFLAARISPRRYALFCNVKDDTEVCKLMQKHLVSVTNSLKFQAKMKA